MITSSLPPELKVVIASAVLLAGGLLALRFPAERDPMQSHALRQYGAHQTPTTTNQKTALQQQSPNEGFFPQTSGSTTQYISSDDFVESLDSRDVATVTSATASNGDHLNVVSTSPMSSPPDYRMMTYRDSSNADNNSHVSDHGLVGGQGPAATHGVFGDQRVTDFKMASLSETVTTHEEQQAEYKPFQSTPPLSMPEPNPAFFVVPPRPPIFMSSAAEHSTAAASLPTITPAPLSSSSTIITASNTTDVRVLTARPISHEVRKFDGTNGATGIQNVIYANANAVILPDRQHSSQNR